jgi:hypothetical protein
MSEFLQYKEKWLVAVAANIHEWFPVAVAVALARYFNSKTEEAFPSVDTLADELDTDRRNAQHALDRLVRAEWLTRTRSRGRGPNHYRISFPSTYYSTRSTACDDTLFNSNEAASTAYHRTPDRVSAHPEPRGITRPNLEELRLEPRTPRRRAAQTSPTSRKAGIKGTTIPKGWELATPHLASARQLAGWDADRAEEERQKFVDWHTDHETERRDWSGRAAAQLWQNWCRQGRTIDKRDGERETQTTGAIKPGVQRAVNGAQRWVNQQRAAAAGLYVGSSSDQTKLQTGHDENQEG